jgi:hypothetical protein
MFLPRVSSIFKKISPKTFGPHCVSSSHVSLVNEVESKVRDTTFARSGCVHVTLYKNIKLNKAALFLKLYYSNPFQDPTISVASITPVSQACASTMLLLTVKLWVGVAPSGLTFVPNVMKIGHMIQKLNRGWAHMEQGHFTRPLSTMNRVSHKPSRSFPLDFTTFARFEIPVVVLLHIQPSDTLRRSRPIKYRRFGESMFLPSSSCSSQR